MLWGTGIDYLPQDGFDVSSLWSVAGIRVLVLSFFFRLDFGVLP